MQTQSGIYLKENFMTHPAITYAEQHQTEFLDDLKTWLRIPSISTKDDHKPYVRQAAEWVADHCRALGFTRVEIFDTARHPIVYAEWLGAGDAPTVLAYGHYDVQPAGDEAKWTMTDGKAFEPQVHDGILYGRGSADDKGQVFMHLKTFEALMKTTGTFPINLKLLLEGEEEIGSTNLVPFIENHKDLLQADVVVVSDTSMAGEGQPAIVYALRGVVDFEIEIFGPKSELHSGTYGGTVHNPLQAMCELLASIHDANGTITIPHFYDDVLPITDEERTTIEQEPYDDELWHKETGAPQPWGESQFTLKERRTARPTFEINGLIGGYTEKGSKMIVPPSMLAKLSCRLVAHQDPKKIFELIKDYVLSYVPPTVKVEVRYVSSGHPAIVARESAAMRAAIQAYKTVFGKEPVMLRAGGSIPVVASFQTALGLDSVLIGFGLPDDNIHAPNEKFALEQFRLGIHTLIHFYQLIK
jgi:acetylornithine deacetylase/succinyl-diaminopimelate desuccinylase-like protein